MKRTALRRRSPKRPAWEDLPLRGWYCQQNYFDEPLFYCGLAVSCGRLFQSLPSEVRFTHDVNHIFTNPRRDLRSNFMSMLRGSHDWFHANLHAGRVVCVLTKLIKAEKLSQPEECSLAELDLCAGGDGVIGLIAGYDFAGDEMMMRMQQDCLIRLNELE